MAQEIPLFTALRTHVPPWSYVAFAIGIVLLVWGLWDRWTLRVRALEAQRSLRRRAGIPDSDRRPWAVAARAAEERKQMQEAEYRRRRASNAGAGNLRPRRTLGLPQSTIFSPRQSPAPSLSGYSRHEHAVGRAASPRQASARVSAAQSIPDWQRSQTRSAAPPESPRSHLARNAMQLEQQQQLSKFSEPASLKKRRLPNDIDTNLHYKRKKSETPDYSSAYGSDDLEDHTRRVRASHPLYTLDLDINAKSLAPPPTTPRLRQDSNRKRSLPTSDFFGNEPENGHRSAKRARQGVSGNLTAELSASSDADTESESTTPDDMNGVEQVTARPLKRAHDIDEQSERDEEEDEDDDDDTPHSPPTKRGKIAPSDHSIRRVGEEWTNADGDRFRIDFDGVRRKLCAVYEDRFKYQMPSDSTHPARNATERVEVNKWMTQDEFEQARRRGNVVGIEIPVASEEPVLPPSGASANSLRDGTRGLPRDDSVYFTKGSGTPLRPRPRTSSTYASATSSRASSRPISPALAGARESAGTPPSARLRISSRGRASTGIPLGALLPRSRVSSPGRQQLWKGQPAALDASLHALAAASEPKSQLVASASAPVLSTLSRDPPAVRSATTSASTVGPQTGNPFAGFVSQSSTAVANAAEKLEQPLAKDLEPKAGLTAPVFTFPSTATTLPNPLMPAAPKREEPERTAASDFPASTASSGAGANAPAFPFDTTGSALSGGTGGLFNFNAPAATSATTPFVFGAPLPTSGIGIRPATPRGSRNGGRTRR